MTGSEVSISIFCLPPAALHLPPMARNWETGKLPEAGIGTEKGLTVLNDSDSRVSLILELRLTLRSQTLHGVEQATPI